MTQASLITDYLSVLSAQLPAPLVEELADGLDETQQHYLTQGLTPDAAAGAAVAEFGEPQVIVAACSVMPGILSRVPDAVAARVSGSRRGARVMARFRGRRRAAWLPHPSG